MIRNDHRNVREKARRSDGASRLNGRAKLKAGRKTKEWIATRRRLKVKFEAMGITSCELNYSGCYGDGWLSFAHGRRRRHLVGNELEDLVILACTPCHDVLDRMAPSTTLAIVQGIIAERGVWVKREV